jgi:hypothetical protein
MEFSKSNRRAKPARRNCDGMAPSQDRIFVVKNPIEHRWRGTLANLTAFVPDQVEHLPDRKGPWIQRRIPSSSRFCSRSAILRSLIHLSREDGGWHRRSLICKENAGPKASHHD